MIEAVEAQFGISRDETTAVGQCRQTVAAFHRHGGQHEMARVRRPVITEMHNCFTARRTLETLVRDK